MLENPNAVANLASFPDPSCFDQRWVFGAQIGKDTSSNFALSFNGLAVRTADNRFVVPELDGGVAKITDVTCLTIGLDPFVFRTPVPADQVEPGNLLVRSDTPFALIFVEENEGGRLRGIDPRTDEAVEVLIADKSLGIPSLMVRVVSLLDGFDGGLFKGGGDGGSDFGGLLPLLLLSGGLGGGQGLLGAGGNNQLLLALALSKSSIDPTLALLLSSGGLQSNSLALALLLASRSGKGGLFSSRRKTEGKYEAKHELKQEPKDAGPKPTDKGPKV